MLSPICLRLLLISSLLSIFSLKSFSLNYYWIGNSGNWTELSHWATTSGGSTLHTQIPTALDDVYFDANSFTIPGQAVNFDALTTLAHDINWTGISNLPDMNGTSTIRLYGSLTLVTGMTMNFGGAINFEATTAGKTITSAGKVFANEVAFNGIGGGWTLQDAFTVNLRISLNAGVFNTNNQTISTPNFWSLSNATRELNMGSSVFNLSGSYGWRIENPGFTVHCGTSVVNLTGIIATFQGNSTGTDTYYDINFTGIGEGTITGAGNFHDVVFWGKGYIYNTGSFHNVTFHGWGEIGADNVYNDVTFTAGATYQLGVGFTQTINGIFTAAGTCTLPITIISNFQGYASTISHPPATVNVSYVNMRDIHATGGAGFFAGNSNDLTNNTGWTFIPASIQNLYWIGNSGNWDDGNHWSLSSGGTAWGCTPTPTANVFFDVNSFSVPGQTVLINVFEANCRNMDWTGVTNTPTLGSTFMGYNYLNIYGSLKFSPAMIMAFDGKVDFESTSPGQTITSAGKFFINETRFNGSTGEWSLQDTFNSDSTIFLNCGTLNTNNQTVNADGLTSANFFPRILNMGSSVFYLHEEHAWVLGGANINLNSGTSVINLTHKIADFSNTCQDLNTYYNVNFTGSQTGLITGSALFHDVSFSAKGIIRDTSVFHSATFHGDGEITSNNVYDDLHFSVGHTYILPMNHTQTINGTFDALGTCGSLITITSEKADSTTFIKKLSGAVNITNIVMRDVHTAGAAVFTASGSIDLGNNTGWTFNTAPGTQNLYWVGNSGNWEDGNHWSFTSGGAPSGCAPGPMNNVFFDVNSFSANGQQVVINITTTYCRNMDWTGSLHNPTFVLDSYLLTLKIYGSLTFISAMTTTLAGKVHFEATSTGQTITSATKVFTNEVAFNGDGGEWTLLDSIKTTNTIFLNNGTFNTNNFNVNAWSFLSTLETTRSLNMGSSVFTMGKVLAWAIAGPGITINSGTSTINCTDIGGVISNSGLIHTYYDVNIAGTGTISGSANFHDVLFADTSQVLNSCSFHTANFQSEGSIHSSNVYENLYFTAGHAYILGKNGTQTINGTFNASGNCGSLISISSDMADSTATISHPPGAVNITDVVLKDIHAVGGATFTANNCLDLGNNTGWTINASPNTNLYWIGNSGDWDDGNHWSFTSGGPSSGCSPTAVTNVFFDANSFSSLYQVVLINVPVAYCRNMNWTGATNTPTFASHLNSDQLNIYGSLITSPTMIIGFAGRTNFEAVTTGQTIAMNGNMFTGEVAFNGTGEWILQDGFTAGTILLNNGILNTNDQPVAANNFISLINAGATLNMGSSVFTLAADSAWKIINNDLIINCGTSVINCLSGDASFRDNSTTVHTYYDVNFSGTVKNNIIGTGNFHNVDFAGKGYIYEPHQFYDVTFNADGQIDSNNVFHELNFTEEHSYVLGEGSTQQVNNRWLIQGTCTKYIILQTNNAGSFATVSCAADTVFGHNIHLRDIHCTGPAAFMAYNSVDLGGNSGWNFSVLPPLSNTGSIFGPATVCAGSTGIIYHVTAVQGAINYQWTVPPGATITGGQGTDTITVDFGTVVSGNITVQACGSCGCSNISISSPIVISAPAVLTATLNATPGNTICAGTPVNFTATVAGAGSSTVVYDFKVNNVSVQTGSLNTWSTAGLADGDIITCIITVSGSGCFTANTVSSNSITIDVLSQLTPGVSLVANPGTDICSGTVVTFTATAINTATAVITYDFKKNGTSVQSSNSNIYTSAALADGDVISCIISLSGAGNCFTSTEALSDLLTIHSTPSLTPSVTIVADPGNTVCPATAVSFTATANNTGASAINYDFIINGISVQNGPSNMYSSTVLNGDVVSCVISITAGACFTSNTATSNSIVMNVGTNSGNVYVNAGTDVTISAGQTVQLNAGGDAGTYLWSPSTGLSATNILNPVAAPVVTTTYILTITNALGCSASDDIKVEVKDNPNTGCIIDPMIALTPNGDGINDRWIVWKGSCSGPARVTVFNRYGGIVFQSQHYQNDWQGTYKGKQLPDGTYYFIVEFKLNNGNTIIKRNNVTILR